MAAIKVYQSDVPAPRPNESVAPELAAGGRVIGQSIEQVGNQFQELQNKSEMADLTANMAKTKADLEIEWQKRLRETDPSDPKFKTLAQDFNNDVVQPAIEKAGSGFLTNEANFASRQMSGILGADMLRSSVADQAQVQGTYAVTRVKQINSELAQMAFNDPAQYDSAQMLKTAMLKGAIHNMGLPAEEEAKLELELGQEITRATFQGAAVKSADPELLKRMAQDPKYSQYLPQSDLYTYITDSERQFSMQRAEARAGDADAKQKASENYNAGINKLIGDSFQPGTGTYQVTADTFRSLAQLNSDPAVLNGLVPASTVKANLDFFLAMEKRDNQVATDPHVYEDFRRGILDGTKTDRDIIAARGVSLSDHDANELRSDLGALSKDPARKDAEKQFATFMANQKPAFTSANWMGMKDPAGNARYYAYWHDAHDRFMQAYGQGPDAWKPLLDPHDKQYLGNSAKQYITGQKGASLSPQIQKIGGDAEYAKLPHGAVFQGPDGVTRTKP